MDEYMMPLLPGNLEYMLNETISAGPSREIALSRMMFKAADVTTFLLEVGGMASVIYAAHLDQPRNTALLATATGMTMLSRYLTYRDCKRCADEDA